jgi:hypothetical protein
MVAIEFRTGVLAENIGKEPAKLILNSGLEPSMLPH